MAQESGRKRRASRGEALTVYLPEKVAEKLRIRAVREKRSISSTVEVALQHYFQRPVDRPKG